jgi:hypothetical protein
VERVLRGNDPAAFGLEIEDAAQALDQAAVERADGWHINDFSIEQFNARVRRQHARLRHAVILLHAEAMFRLDDHGETLANCRNFGKRLSAGKILLAKGGFRRKILA